MRIYNYSLPHVRHADGPRAQKGLNTCLCLLLQYKKKKRELIGYQHSLIAGVVSAAEAKAGCIWNVLVKHKHFFWLGGWLHVYIAYLYVPWSSSSSIEEVLVSHPKTSYFTLGEVLFPLCSVNILIFQSLLENIKGKRNEGAADLLSSKSIDTLLSGA